MFLRLNRQRRGSCHSVAKRYVILPLCAGSLKASSLPFVVLASKSAVVHSQNGPRDPVLEQYEIHRATPESPRSQKMCIALVLRTVVSNKYGELLIFDAPLASFFNFPRVSAVSSIFLVERFWHFNTHPWFNCTDASLFPERNGYFLKLQALDANLGTRDSQPTPFGGGGPPWLR